MLATRGEIVDLSGHDDWWCEMKWDGVRAIVAVDRRGEAPVVTVLARSGRDVTATYPEVAEVADLVGESCVLDGEIVALRNGRPDFELLQKRIGLTAPREIEAVAARIPVNMLLFDLMYVGGDSLLRAPYQERRQHLEALVGSGAEHVQVPVAVPPGPGAAQHALDVSRELRLEGIMAKRASSTYQQSRRTRTWIKIKHASTQDVIVIGARASTASRPFASLLVAVPDDDGVLHYAGRVGTGFSVAELKRSVAMLGEHARATPAADDVPALDRRDATWVEPALVGEVTNAGRTDAGILRHAVWRGWRPDTDPAHVRWESRR